MYSGLGLGSGVSGFRRWFRAEGLGLQDNGLVLDLLHSDVWRIMGLSK